MAKILCVSRFFKGNEFMISGTQSGAEMYLLTSSKLKDEAWPYDHIKESFYMPEDSKGNWNMPTLINSLAYIFRTKKFDALVALDDFDVEIVAAVREYFRIPGMGETTARFFRDKLAMRIKARDEGVPNPVFSSLFYDDEINHFLDQNTGPFMIKPRGQASATGIKKVENKDHAWQVIHELGDNRHNFLIESFKPGAVYHVDALIWDGKAIFNKASRYLDTPFTVAHGGGIFRSVSMQDSDKEAKKLHKLNIDLLKAFGLKFGASHSEFIKDAEGNFFFLETSSRVGGAHLAEMVEAASEINLWAEWAKIEIAMIEKKNYILPKSANHSAGIVVSLSRYQHPETCEFNEPEIYWRMDKDHHVGFILRASSDEKVIDLLENYTQRINEKYHASLPAPDRPTN